MRLSELIAYAKETYHIEEEHKWTDFPGFSVLCHPRTGKWAALLMRRWDAETGREIERCDLKCGESGRLRFSLPYLSSPLRMRGGKWISVAFDDSTRSEVVFELFDRAIREVGGHGATIVLSSRPEGGGDGYAETELPFARSGCRSGKEQIPERLRRMRRLYAWGRESAETRAQNFYKQALFMADYEDDVPWTGDFVCYFPTYRDLSTIQLRGYFTWRAALRRGEAGPISASAAYLYVYELLNGVGANTARESYEKLREFERLFLDSGIGDIRMRQNLRRWMLEFAVLNDLPQPLAQQSADQELLARDEALAVLRAPTERSDEEIVAALCLLGGKKLKSSPVLIVGSDRGKTLFAQCWRGAVADRRQEKDLFTLCFGSVSVRRWYPLANAVYYERSKPKDREYVLDDCRSYRCRGGVWQTASYEKTLFDKARLQGFLHETDARLRWYLKTGRYLKENPADAWAAPWIDAVIEADRRAAEEAARPKITIDFSGLERIRADAALTRESLLTADEIDETEETGECGTEKVSVPAGEEADVSALPAVLIRILRELLDGGDASERIRESRLMPSIAADEINEALFDAIGDAVVLCEGDRLFLAEDYIEELEQILGGTKHGRT